MKCADFVRLKRKHLYFIELRKQLKAFIWIMRSMYKKEMWGNNCFIFLRSIKYGI